MAAASVPFQKLKLLTGAYPSLSQLSSGTQTAPDWSQIGPKVGNRVYNAAYLRVQKENVGHIERGERADRGSPGDRGLILW